VAKDKKTDVTIPSEVPALPSMTDGLGRYLAEIKRFPLLEANEEYMLAKRWQEHQDPKAAEKLVSAHLRLVAKIANGYRGYGLPVIDLIAEGNVGLMQALRKYDPEMGFRFSTYAMWWIRANIQEYILHTWSLVKIGTTAAQKSFSLIYDALKEKCRGLKSFISPTKRSKILRMSSMFPNVKSLKWANVLALPISP
jgi:RNA polymerase sigma-32 factor